MNQCKCGSFAFNLAQDGIDQCDLCDRHYWQDRAEKAEQDAVRINWLETAFDKSWNGVIDSGSITYWRIAGDHRHRFQNMNGATFRDAIDAAIAKDAP